MENNQNGNGQNDQTPQPEFGATGLQSQDQPVDQTLTTRQGHPLTHNQNVRTIGNRGPTTLENYPFLEKISHFDRERIPERVVHARGAGAHGVFEAYVQLAMSQCRNIHGLNCFSRKARKHQFSSGFRLLSTVGIRPKRSVTPVALP